MDDDLGVDGGSPSENLRLVGTNRPKESRGLKKKSGLTHIALHFLGLIPAITADFESFLISFWVVDSVNGAEPASAQDAFAVQIMVPRPWPLTR